METPKTRTLPGRWSIVAVTLAVTLTAPDAGAAPVPVSTAAGLLSAVSNAKPGDVITLSAGTYTIKQKVSCSKAGAAGAPIVVRSAAGAAVKIRFDTAEGFKVSAPHWRFEGLDIEGICASHSTCEHAFHVVGKADFTQIRRCRMHEFNAMIKGNGEPVGAGGSYVWPDDVLIEGCEMFSKTARNTSNPVTPIDVVGGRRWIVRGNYIHDHAKGGGNKISYAAFLKGNSRSGLFERNLVICEKLHKGQVRLGLSFGGGGSSPDKICEGGVCSPEHQNGVMRNNIIVNCPADVGIYLNEAKGSRIHNNTLYNSTGIDVRFAASSADLRNNVLSGKIRNRDGGSSTRQSNLESVTAASFKAWFKDPAASDFSLVSGAQVKDKGVNLKEVTDDFCNNTRDDGKNDRGAVEYDGDGPCDTTKPFAGGAPPKQDGGVPFGDGGGGDTGTGDGPGPGHADLFATDAGGSGDDAAAGGDQDDGCSCELNRPRRGALPALMLLLVGMLLLRRRP